MNISALDKLLEKWAVTVNGIDQQALALKILKSAKAELKIENRVSDKSLFHNFINLSGNTEFLKALPGNDELKLWSELIFKAIQRSDYSLNDMFEHRVKTIPEQALFMDMSGDIPARWTYKQVQLYVREIASVFYRHANNSPHVALYAENSVESACCDLACLFYDIFDTPLNVHFNKETLYLIFDQLEINIAVADTQSRANILEEVREMTKKPFTIFVLDPDAETNEKDIFFLGEECKVADLKDIDQILSNRKRKPINQVATTMFTSGSTGLPKGVSFSIYNLVSKRFARAAAVPLVGNQEVLLCFLPLYHTFGRYLELLGSIYWNGTYVFTGNTSAETLIS
ncbi:MAG: AMP-binding protein, partial [Bacteroidota bacterium]